MLTRFPPLRGLSLAPRSLPRPLAATSQLCALSAIHGSSALQRRHQSSSSNRSNDSSGNGGPRNAASSSNNSDGDTDSDDDGCDEETDNRSHPEGDPNSASDAPQQPLFHLHRIDLAHGSFFALHRPLLGITNGPMFSNNPYDHPTSHNSSNSNSSSSSIGAGAEYDGLLEEPMEELIHFFDSLYPYGPPVVGQPTLQSVGTTATATAWASMPQLLPGLIVNGVDEFLSDIQDKHAMEQLEYEAEQARLSSRAAAASPSTAPPSKTTSDRSGSAWSESESGTESKVYELEDVMQMMNVMRKRMIKMRNSNNNNNGNHSHQQGGNDNNNKSKYRKRSTSPRKKFDK